MNTYTETSSDIASRRRLAAFTVGAAAAVSIALSLMSIGLFITRIGFSGSFDPNSILIANFASLIGPALLLVFAPMIARGRSGAAAAAVVICGVLAVGSVVSLLFHTLQFGDRFDARSLIASVIPGLLRIALMAVAFIFALRLWTVVRVMWPDPSQVAAAKSAWFRARVALVVSWALLVPAAGIPLVFGLILYLEDPKLTNIGGGIGLILLIFGGIVTAFGIWLFLLWLRLRRRGPIVARSTAWQIFSMLLMMVLFGGSTHAAAGPGVFFGMLPTAIVAWILIELMHASIARREGAPVGGFDVVTNEQEIPMATAATPPPLPGQFWQAKN